MSVLENDKNGLVIFMEISVLWERDSLGMLFRTKMLLFTLYYQQPKLGCSWQMFSEPLQCIWSNTMFIGRVVSSRVILMCVWIDAFNNVVGLL